MAWWLVTWTTYGSWLPGDPRGYQTWRGHEYVPPPRRYAKPGEEIYNETQHQERYAAATRITDAEVMLDFNQRQVVRNSLVEEIALLSVVPAVLSIGAQHVHWLAQFGELLIRPTVGRLKAAATRRLRETRFSGKRPWTKGCHMRSKATPQAFQHAYAYIVRHRAEDCLIVQWNSPEVQQWLNAASSDEPN